MTSRPVCRAVGVGDVLVATALVVTGVVAMARVDGPNPGAGNGLVILLGLAYGVVAGFVGVVVLAALRQRADGLARTFAVLGLLLLVPPLLALASAGAGAAGA